MQYQTSASAVAGADEFARPAILPVPISRSLPR